MARLTFNQDFDIRKAINQAQPFGDVTADLIIQPLPTNIFRIRGDMDYNLYGLGLRSASADVSATYRDVMVSAGYRFNAISGSNFVETRVAARILANLDAHLGVNYDIIAGKSIENRLGFDWRFQCFVISAEFVQRKGNENEFHVAISLLGVGQIGTKGVQ